MALFGEKYGDTVRVANVSGWSIELCGGCHVDNTAKLGLFKILKESSVAAGIRRIEATTGSGVLQLIEDNNRLIQEAAQNLKLGNPAELAAKTAAMTSELKAKERKLEELEAKLAQSKITELLGQAKAVGSLRLVTADIEGAKPDTLRSMGDQARGNSPELVAVLSAVADGKASILVACGADAVKAGAHAGKLVKELTALAGGSGGGRPDSAMGGTSELAKLEDALAKAPELLAAMLKA